MDHTAGIQEIPSLGESSTPIFEALRREVQLHNMLEDAEGRELVSDILRRRERLEDMRDAGLPWQRRWRCG